MTQRQFSLTLLISENINKVRNLLIFVGRVARAGRAGLAISLVDSDELPYLIDLFVFLGRQVITVNPSAEDDDPNIWPNELLASCPHDLLVRELESISKHEKYNAALASLFCKYDFK